MWLLLPQDPCFPLHSDSSVQRRVPTVRPGSPPRAIAEPLQEARGPRRYSYAVGDVFLTIPVAEQVVSDRNPVCTSVSISIRVPSFTLKQSKSDFLTYFSPSTSHTIGALPDAPRCNITRGISAGGASVSNFSLSNLRFLPPSSHTLTVHSYTWSLDFSPYKLKNVFCFFGEESIYCH